jgi:hypothetical protein
VRSVVADAASLLKGMYRSNALGSSENAKMSRYSHDELTCGGKSVESSTELLFLIFGRCPEDRQSNCLLIAQVPRFSSHDYPEVAKSPAGKRIEGCSVPILSAGRFVESWADTYTSIYSRVAENFSESVR